MPRLFSRCPSIFPLLAIALLGACSPKSDNATTGAAMPPATAKPTPLVPLSVVCSADPIMDETSGAGGPCTLKDDGGSSGSDSDPNSGDTTGNSQDNDAAGNATTTFPNNLCSNTNAVTVSNCYPPGDANSKPGNGGGTGTISTGSPEQQALDDACETIFAQRLQACPKSGAFRARCVKAADAGLKACLRSLQTPVIPATSQTDQHSLTCSTVHKDNAAYCSSLGATSLRNSCSQLAATADINCLHTPRPAG